MENLLLAWVRTIPKDKDGNFIGPHKELATTTELLLVKFGLVYENEVSNENRSR